MNRPLGQALQIVLLGLLIVFGSAWVFWSWTQGSPSASYSIADSEPQRHSLIVLVCMAGAVGGVANNFRRLQKLPTRDWQTLDSTSRWLMTLQIYVSPFIGSLFAFVLYGAFASNLLQGALFPAFDLGTPFEGLAAFSDQTIPSTNQDVGKALIWAFAAGFAENLVPNFIDKLASEVRTASQTT